MEDDLASLLIKMNGVLGEVSASVKAVSANSERTSRELMLLSRNLARFEKSMATMPTAKDFDNAVSRIAALELMKEAMPTAIEFETVTTRLGDVETRIETLDAVKALATLKRIKNLLWGVLASLIVAGASAGVTLLFV